jgi:hypothetical protein
MFVGLPLYFSGNFGLKNPFIVLDDVEFGFITST